MEYVPGIKINRIKALDQLGVDRKRYHSKLTNFITHCLFNLHVSGTLTVIIVC